MPLNTPNLAGDVSGGVYATSVDKLKGNTVAGTSPASGQVLTWDGSQWAPATPNTGGGGGANGLTYYLNQNTAADSPVTGIPGTPKQLGRVGETSQTSVTTGTLTQNTWTRVAGFVSESAPQDPATILIPAGLWDLNVWALGTANINAPSSIRVLIYTYDGTATTLIATSSATVIGTSSTQYSVSALVPQTTIAATDRIYIELQALATGTGHTVTAQFGDGTPSHIHTSLPLVGGTGLWKNVSGALQSPATLLVDADVDAAAAIAQSKISGLTTALSSKAAQTQIDVFTTVGTATWTKPTGAKSVHIQCIGGGGGGGAGRASASGTAAGGGGGGGSGARSFMFLDASFFSATETVTVGAGGAGATGVAVGNNGGNGATGTASSFGTTNTWVYAGPGGGGVGGSNTSGGAGGALASRGLQQGANGGAASSTFSTGAAGGNGIGGAPASGGGGGGITSGGVVSSAGSGGFQFIYNGGTMAQTPVNTAGFSVPTNSPFGGSGGGGGNGSTSTTGSNGGAGGNYGAGGGGGGPSVGFNSGAGGNGAGGIVVVTTYF